MGLLNLPKAQSSINNMVRQRVSNNHYLLTIAFHTFVLFGNLMPTYPSHQLTRLNTSTELISKLPLSKSKTYQVLEEYTSGKVKSPMAAQTSSVIKTVKLQQNQPIVCKQNSYQPTPSEPFPIFMESETGGSHASFPLTTCDL